MICSIKRPGILLLAALFLIGSFSLFAAPVRDDRIHELVLLHSNDHHGTILPRGERGGLAQRAAFVRGIRELHPNVLLLDAGDINTGTALSNMFQAAPDFLAYSMMGYDAMVFGNHEFNEGLERMEMQMALAGFPIFASNVTRADGSFLGGRQYIVKNFDGFSVGIFALTTLRTLVISNPDRSLAFIDEIEAAREAVDILRNREGVDIVIALTHLGTAKESSLHISSQELAAAVAGIDIIVDGHSHEFMETALKVGNTWIVTAHERGMVLGRGILSIQNGRFVNFDWAPVEISSIEPDIRVSAMLRPFIELADISLREVVGEAADTFIFGDREPRFHETAIGNMVCDATAWFFREVFDQELDFAFHNGGNIRAELPQGPITRESILTVLPFENNLFIASLSGRDLIDLFDFMAAIPQGAGGFPQFSSEVRVTLDASTQSIVSLTIGGEPVDPDRIYRFSTNDFLLGGGDGYTVLAERSVEPYNTSLLLAYAVIDYIRAQNGGVITPHVDGRINIYHEEEKY